MGQIEVIDGTAVIIKGERVSLVTDDRANRARESLLATPGIPGRHREDKEVEHEKPCDCPAGEENTSRVKAPQRKDDRNCGSHEIDRENWTIRGVGIERPWSRQERSRRKQRQKRGRDRDR